jgi:hypothetical protein
VAAESDELAGTASKTAMIAPRARNFFISPSQTDMRVFIAMQYLQTLLWLVYKAQRKYAKKYDD